MTTEIFSKLEVQKICAGAATIDERSVINREVSEVRKANKKAEYRSGIWLKTAARGNKELFCRIIEQRGTSFRFCSALFEPIVLFDGGILPEWHNTFSWSVELMRVQTKSKILHGFLKTNYPLAFEDLFVNLVVEADKKVVKGLLENYKKSVVEMVSVNARSAVQRSLLIRVSGLMSEVIYRKYNLYRIHNMEDFSRAKAHPGSSKGFYEDFIFERRDSLLRSIFLDFPVLARLVSVAVKNWVDMTDEMLRRLFNDWVMIESVFNAGASIGRLTGIEPLGSDSHNNGRTAWVFTFSDIKVVYKPRSLIMERAWEDLNKWMSLNGAPIYAEAAVTIEREGYGWMEWINHRPDGGKVSEYFERFGATLCITHILNGNDLHFENIIARGASPVLIDLETLFHPRSGFIPDIEGMNQSDILELKCLRDTVAWTGLLPSWMIVGDRQLVGIGGLNMEDISTAEVIRFLHTNTDDMVLGLTSMPEDSRGNLPSSLKDVSGYMSAMPYLVGGFSAMWDFISNNKQALLASGGPLQFFARALVRVLIRPTQLYAMILKRSISLEYMVDGAAWSAQLDYLWRVITNPQQVEKWYPLIREEYRQLSQMDIPYFNMEIGSVSLRLINSNNFESAFLTSPMEEVKDRIFNMSNKEKSAQICFTQQSIMAMVNGAQRQSISKKAVNWNARITYEPDLFIGAAQTIAETLQEASIRQEGASWISLSPVISADHRQIALAGYDLYSGSAGIALFFSALERVQRNGYGRSLVKSSTASLLKLIESPQKNLGLLHSIGIGGGVGVGSIIYALVHIYNNLAEPEFLRAAKQVARMITPEVINNDVSFDALDGAAGSIFGLLSLASATNEQWPLDIAISCGHHLLNKSVDTGLGTVGWKTMGVNPLLGMAHGNAGIALALLNLSSYTKLREFSEIAYKALGYERRLFDLAGRGWPDLRTKSNQNGELFLCRWCHGAAGIGLARLASLDFLSDTVIMTEIESARLLTMKSMNINQDCLCCGNFGRIEFLFTTGIKLKNKNIVKQSRLIAARALALRKHSLHFRGGINDFLNPGFHTGIAGIGYQLLRMVRPDQLSSILSWEDSKSMSP